MASLRSLRLASAAVLILAVTTAGIMEFVGHMLIAPAREEIGPPPPELSATRVGFRSASGEVYGWFAPGTPGRGTILLLHGVHASRLAMLPRARWLHSLGYSVLLIDFQAAGESDGNAVTFGYRESFDVSAALSWLRTRLPDERIGIIATSMGGAAVLLAEPPVRVDAIVLEQVYPTIQEATRDRLVLHLGSIGQWLTPPFLTSMRFLFGVDPGQLRPIDHIGSLSSPKLLIAGDADLYTRLAESRAMFVAAGAKSSLWIVPGASHVDLFHYAGDDYRRHVGKFLDLELHGVSRE
ncbi:alpha/beta hydrolase [Dyella sp. Tek66A03]|uniref:alpha/beta hydrolase n=1 Tax=Dyella sp. Tek66A03 TaxID=3458298 RepID=UPI00403E463A